MRVLKTEGGKNKNENTETFNKNKVAEAAVLNKAHKRQIRLTA